MLKSIMKISASIAALVLIASPVAAADATKPAKACFWTRNVNGWSAADDRTVYIKVGVKDVYRLDLMGPCPDIDWNWRLGLESRGSSWICSALDATIIAHSPIGPQRCPVSKVTRLTPDEIAALPRKSRP